MPVELIEQKENLFIQFGWNPKSEQSIMPVITPSNLAQNSAYNVNVSTFKIIQNEMRKGFWPKKNIKIILKIINQRLKFIS